MESENRRKVELNRVWKSNSFNTSFTVTTSSTTYYPSTSPPSTTNSTSTYSTSITPRPPPPPSQHTPPPLPPAPPPTPPPPTQSESNLAARDISTKKKHCPPLNFPKPDSPQEPNHANELMNRY